MKKPSLVSLFTGAGGLDLGLEQAGFETLFANEIEPYACETLRANRALRALAIEVLLPAPSYTKLKETFDGVSYGHNFKQLIEALQVANVSTMPFHAPLKDHSGITNDKL